MKIIVSGVFSFIGLLLIFIINLSKSKGVAGILISPIVGAAIIFGVVFGVLILLSKILNVDSILAEKQENEASTTEAANKNPSTGNTVNLTISDEDNDANDKSETASSTNDVNNDLPDIDADKSLHVLESESDSETAAESDLTNKSIDLDSPIEDFGRKKITPGMPTEEIIKDKLGIAATPEDIAKGIKTILKRQGGLSDDK